MGRVNFFSGIILLALLIWAGVGGVDLIASAGDSFSALLGAVLFITSFLYSLIRRTAVFSQSKGIWSDLHILVGSAGISLIIVHSGGIFLSLTGFLTVALVLLFFLGLNLRFITPHQGHRSFDSRIHLFLHPAGNAETLKNLIQAKEALLRRIDPRAVEGTFGLGLQDWVRNPWRAARYLWLVMAEKRLVRQMCGHPLDYLRFSHGLSRSIHIALAVAVVIGFLLHILQSCPYLNFF